MIRIIFALLLMIFSSFALIDNAWADDNPYAKEVTAEELKNYCLISDKPKDPKEVSGAGIIPEKVLTNISQNIKDMTDATSDIMALGSAIMCASTKYQKKVEVLTFTLFSYPRIPEWICGAIIYFFGFMITMSVTFYLADVAFKLGFAVMMLPVGIGLWPFSPTKDKLAKIISIILKNAGIFVFLSLTISFALALLDSALADNATSTSGGTITVASSTAGASDGDTQNIQSDNMSSIFKSIAQGNNIESVFKLFTLISMNFLLIIFALAYGMQLIGNAIPDYVDKFFPDGVFGSASPIHGSMTQAVDFAKQKAVAPVASFAGDVVRTQTGNLMKGTGKLISGKYNKQIGKGLRTLNHYRNNPDELLGKTVQALGNAAASTYAGTGKFVNKALIGTLGRLALNKAARHELQHSLNSKLDQQKNSLKKVSANVGQGVEKAANAIGNRTWAGRALKEINNEVNTVAKDLATVTNTVVVKPIKTTYNAAMKGLNTVQDKITEFRDDAKNLVTQETQNIKDNIDAKHSNKVARGILKTGVNFAGWIAKTGISTTSGLAKAPGGLAKTALNMPKTVLDTTATVLTNVGEDMSRKRSIEERNADIRRHNAELAAEEEKERRAKRESQV